MTKVLPARNEIQALIEEDPDKVASFANRLFLSDNFSESELVDFAGKLLQRSSKHLRPHLWEAFGQAIRSREIRSHSDWFLLARQRLVDQELPSEETGAIRDFLSDLRILSSELTHDRLTADDSEWDWYAGINHMTRSVGKSKLGECISILTEASSSESFLIRESVVESLAILFTRSDLTNQDLLPFQVQLSRIVSHISSDSDKYVLQSLDTVLPLLGMEAQM